MNGRIVLTREGPVATVAIANPAKLNALTVAMWRELANVMKRLAADDSLRCVVLRGDGTEAFAAGADIAEFATERDNAEQGKAYHRELVFGALRAVGECRHPTVAMIHGACAGGGLELACMCDLRIAGNSARFGVPINRLGFSIAWDELSALLPLVGRAVALEILVEGRVWNAAEAMDKGLLTRLVDDDALAAETAAAVQRIAAGAPLVARWHKQFIRRLTPQPVPLTDAEIDANFDYFSTEDYRIGYDAFMNKRKPRFVGR
ncbi:MAG: enoyl-CoA hydratase/isomerase family protein [Burkholderiales bacterium]